VFDRASYQHCHCAVLLVFVKFHRHPSSLRDKDFHDLCICCSCTKLQVYQRFLSCDLWS